eukprot:1397136-Pyramimonas_sp.AAC.1
MWLRCASSAHRPSRLRARHFLLWCMSHPPPLAPLSWQQVVVTANARGRAGAAATAGCRRDALLSRFYWHDPNTLRH